MIRKFFQRYFDRFNCNRSRLCGNEQRWSIPGKLIRAVKVKPEPAADEVEVHRKCQYLRLGYAISLT
jgi:hypothetical protein